MFYSKCQMRLALLTEGSVLYAVVWFKLNYQNGCVVDYLGIRWCSDGLIDGNLGDGQEYGV